MEPDRCTIRAVTPSWVTAAAPVVMPTRVTRTRARPSNGWGSGDSTSFRCSVPPVKSTTTRTNAGWLPIADLRGRQGGRGGSGQGPGNPRGPEPRRAETVSPIQESTSWAPAQGSSSSPNRRRNASTRRTCSSRSPRRASGTSASITLAASGPFVSRTRSAPARTARFADGTAGSLPKTDTESVIATPSNPSRRRSRYAAGLKDALRSRPKRR